jgi:acyl transferase domain-containing protein
MDRAGLLPTDIGCIEVHGTGTSLGDPIEVEAIGGVMRNQI